MNWFQDIFFRRKLTATLAGVRTIALLPVAGGFVGHEMIMPPRTMSLGAATQAPAPGSHRVGLRSTSRLMSTVAGARGFASESVRLPALSDDTYVAQDGQS